MALHTVGDLKDSVAGLLTGTNLNNVTDLTGALERAARTLVQQADVPEASGIQPITLYGGVEWYEAPETLFGTAINLIRRQGVATSPLDYSYKIPLDQFSREAKLFPNGFTMALQYKNGSAQLGISTPNTEPQVDIDKMNEVGDSPNEWAVGGSASGLAKDSTNYYQQPASLRFTLTGSSSGTLTKTLANPLKLTDYDGVGVAFLAIQIPAGATASALTSIALKLGSSSTDYNSTSATEGFLGAWIANDWLLVALDFAGASETGNPDWDAIDYVQITFAHTSTFTNFRVGGLFIALPSANEIVFQSSAIFMASGASPSQSITDDNDTIILNDAAYTLLEHESAYTIALQNAGGVATPLSETLKGILHNPGTGLYPLYRGDNPSGELRLIGSYYPEGYGYGGF